MGAGSKDLESHRKRVEDQYPYEPEGVAALLRDIYRAEARAYDFADLDTFTILADLKIALDTDCLTPRQRQVVALYYFCQLTREQVGEILDISAKQVKKYLDLSYERISREMKSGGASRKGRKIDRLSNSRPLFSWVNDVADGAPVYDVPDEVTTDILHWLSERGDDRAWETLFQRRHGAPGTQREGAEGYKCLNSRQYKYRTDREIQPHHEVMPGRDVTGYYYAKNGKRKKIFKLP